MPSIARAVEHRLLSGSPFTNQIRSSDMYFDDFKFSKFSIETIVKILEVAVLSAFIQGLSIFQQSDHTFSSKIKPIDALKVWKNGSVLRGEMISLLLSFEQDFFSMGDLKTSAKASDFINERIEKFIALKSETNILARLSPCIFSGVIFFLDTYSDYVISSVINKQRNIFGGHKV